MRQITVLEKIYRNVRDARVSLAEMLEEILELDVRVVSVVRGKREWAEIVLEGPDEEVAAKYLESRLGTTSTMDGVGEASIRRGKIVDLGKVGYGVYVDLGIFDQNGSPVDALLPAFSLKKHLGIRGPMSVRHLSRRLGLMDYLPLNVGVVAVDRAKHEIQIRLTNSQARHLSSRTSRFYACGETRRKIKNALQRTGNSSKVVRVKRLGLLECEVQCSKDADPHEILRAIGPMINAQVTVPRGL